MKKIVATVVTAFALVGFAAVPAHAGNSLKVTTNGGGWKSAPAANGL